MKEFVIQKNEENQRLDKYLKKLLPNATTSFLYKMMRKKNITLKIRGQIQPKVTATAIFTIRLPFTFFIKQVATLVQKQAKTNNSATPESIKAHP